MFPIRIEFESYLRQFQIFIPTIQSNTATTQIIENKLLKTTFSFFQNDFNIRTQQTIFQILIIRELVLEQQMLVYHVLLESGTTIFM